MTDMIRFKPVDKEVMIRVAQAQDLPEKMGVDGIGPGAREEGALQQDEQGSNVIFGVQPISNFIASC